MAIVARRRPGAHLVMVGNTRAPIPRDRLPADTLSVLGYVDLPVLQRWMGAADCCVLPLSDTVSNRGRYPAKLSDYLCAGRPIVMTKANDAAEWVEAHRAGWTSEPDAASLADALVLALESRDACRDAGANGRRLAEGPLAWSAVAGELDGFYAARLSNGQAAASTLLDGPRSRW
jgi:glycosyltransferase involved in cell wall biosynthesis